MCIIIYSVEVKEILTVSAKTQVQSTKALILPKLLLRRTLLNALECNSTVPAQVIHRIYIYLLNKIKSIG